MRSSDDFLDQPSQPWLTMGEWCDHFHAAIGRRGRVANSAWYHDNPVLRVSFTQFGDSAVLMKMEAPAPREQSGAFHHEQLTRDGAFQRNEEGAKTAAKFIAVHIESDIP
jgi:hypothetical protein